MVRPRAPGRSGSGLVVTLSCGDRDLLDEG
ncbi:hypothetical protein JOE61_001318 [Nocardioides salarius]|uniref:Uncharacterized protein n=1 Tax=Nocardioides salarius TaxID=374513 RepID=A0ABS2M8I7_9ACTN|nr:hypothetical protein [Nocardioides salarius]